MRKHKPRNLGASVRHRLMDLARKHGDDFQLVLTRYVVERLLFRLSRSAHREAFVLKGAMLFRLWNDQPHRPTRDLDLSGKGEPSIQHLVGVFKAVSGLAVEDDGLVFDPEAVRAELIKEDHEYGGVPRQTVVAEKYQAMVMLGIANSRMKDFFDLWILARIFAFDGPILCRAIQATYRRRKTNLPIEPPLALTAKFGTDAAKVKQWQAFVRKGKLDVGEATLEKVCTFLDGFLMPPTQALIANQPFEKTWFPAGPWTTGQAARPID